MKLNSFLLSLILFISFFASCETGEFDSQGIIREDNIGQRAFLKFDQIERFSSILENNSSQDPWAISHFNIGESDFTNDYSKALINIKDETFPGGKLLNILTYEPAAFDTPFLSPTTNSPSFIVEDEETGNLKVLLGFFTDNEESSKYELLNSNESSELYRVLNDITDDKFTLIGARLNGEIATIVFEKNLIQGVNRINDNRYLEIEDKVAFNEMIVNLNNSLFWRLTSVEVGGVNTSENFQNTVFDFTQGNNTNELSVNVRDLVSINNQTEIADTDGIIKLSEGNSSDDLRLVLNLETDFNFRENYFIINTPQDELGYRVLRNANSKMFILESRDSNGKFIKLIFESQQNTL